MTGTDRKDRVDIAQDARFAFAVALTESRDDPQP